MLLGELIEIISVNFYNKPELEKLIGTHITDVAGRTISWECQSIGVPPIEKGAIDFSTNRVEITQEQGFLTSIRLRFGPSLTIR